MDTGKPFAASFTRDHVQMDVVVIGDFQAEDRERFEAEATRACRNRRREWTVDARHVGGDASAFVEAVLWLRQTWGHVCLLNATPALATAMAQADPHGSVVVRSDARARS